MMEINHSQTVAEVAAASDRYEAALVSNDIATLDELFWHDERVERISARDELVGITAIRAFRAARTTGDLARERLSRSIVCFGDSSATVNVVFRRVADGRVGRQSQTWVRTDAAWRIVSAHISFRENK